MTKAPKCPSCGGNQFEIFVTQKIEVEFFNHEGEVDFNVLQTPHGDEEWDRFSRVECSTDTAECGWSGRLGDTTIY